MSGYSGIETLDIHIDRSVVKDQVSGESNGGDTLTEAVFDVSAQDTERGESLRRVGERAGRRRASFGSPSNSVRLADTQAMPLDAVLKMGASLLASLIRLLHLRLIVSTKLTPKRLR